MTAPPPAGIDLVAGLLGPTTAMRTRRTMLEANVGFMPDEARRIDSCLGPDFQQLLTLDSVPRQQPHETLAAAAIDAELTQLIQHWQSHRQDKASGGWSVALAGWDIPGLARELVVGSESDILLPTLAWATGAAQTARKNREGYTVTGGGSTRGIDIIESATDSVVLNVKRSLPYLSGCHKGATRERLKRWLLRLVFGLENDVDASLLTRLDALHCLSMTARLGRHASQLPGFLHVLPEPLAAASTVGQAALFRPSPCSLDPACAMALPYYALCHGRSAQRNLMADLAPLLGQSMVTFALRAAGYYLAGWWSLVTEAQTVMTMPHAQNAFLLLDRSGAPIGAALKDLRDMEHWPQYRDITHSSIRFQGICRAYLRYEMTVHPLYFDVAPLSRLSLTEALFNFSFFMLRNHVLRGLEASFTEPQDIDSYRRGIAAMLDAMAAGAGPDDILSAGNTPTAPLISIRRIRQRFVQCMEANS